MMESGMTIKSEEEEVGGMSQKCLYHAS